MLADEDYKELQRRLSEAEAENATLRENARSDAQLRAMADAAPVLIWETDPEGVTFVNQHYLDFFGTSFARIKEMGWADFAHPDDLEGYVAAYIKAFNERQPYAYECRFRRADGAYRWMRNSGAPVGKDRFAGATIDITDLFEARSALKDSEERLIMEGARDYAILTIDPTGIIMSWSAGAQNTFGWSPEKAIGQSFEMIFTPEDRAAGAHNLEISTARQKGFSNDKRWHLTESGEQVYMDGSVHPLPLDAQGRERGFIKIARNETQRRLAEDALRELNDTLEQQVGERTAELVLYENIFESDRAPILAFDADYRIIGFNQAQSDAFLRVMGRKHEVGEVLPDLMPLDQASKLRGFMARALAGERFEVIEEFGDSNREKPTWEIIYSPVYDQNGKILGAFQHSRDITERVRADAELREVHEQLRQSQKMEAVGQLTGGLAHDFNNLLAVITGSLELLTTRIAKGRLSDIDRFLVASQTAAKRATSLTHRLLAFSRRQTLDPQQTDANALIAGMADMVRRTVGPEIAVEIARAEDLWTTLVDPGQLENALLNLCINARDAMPEGGRIMIETANKELDRREAQIRELAPGEFVVLSVSDTGTGMPPDVVARVFEPFYTTKPMGHGTGLGLSMVYGFARQSEGQARIHSEVGKGTTINIYLPRSKGSVTTAEADQVSPAPRAEAGQTVLVVDDEPNVRMLVVDVLEDLGYTAVEASDGLAGLKVLQSDLRIDLLVTDVGMPEMNGRQLADAARVARPDLKVMFLTGYAETAVVSHGHLEKGMAIVTKPFGFDDLANRIKSLIGQTL